MQEQKVTTKKKNWLWQTLILQHCLPVSQKAKFTSKNVTQHLLGSRNAYNIFKYENLKHLLLKITPFIGTLFASHIKLKHKIVKKVRNIPPIPPKDSLKLEAWKVKMRGKMFIFKEKLYFYQTIEKKKPLTVLFATTNPHYTEIIQKASQLCQMASYTKRWWGGFLTANFIALTCVRNTQEFLPSNQLKTKFEIKSKKLKLNLNIKNEINQFEPTKLWKKLLPFSMRKNWSKIWQYSRIFKKLISLEKKQHTNQKKLIETIFTNTFKKNKENPEKYYNWHFQQYRTKRPVLVIIPDIHNNTMILKETLVLKIPVIGLVNSDCKIKINYPIFGNANSIKIVHFFSNFIATVIAKEHFEQNYKNKSHRIFAKHRWINTFLAKKKNENIKIRKIHIKWNKKKIKKNINCWNYKKYRTVLSKNKIKEKNKLGFIQKYQRVTRKQKNYLRKIGLVRKKRLLQMRKRFDKNLGTLQFIAKNQNTFVNYWYFKSNGKVFEKSKGFAKNQNIGRLILLGLLKLFKITTKNQFDVFCTQYLYLTLIAKEFDNTPIANLHRLVFERHFNKNYQLQSKVYSALKFNLNLLHIETKLNLVTSWKHSYWTIFLTKTKNMKKWSLNRKWWWRKHSKKFSRGRRKIKWIRKNLPFDWSRTEQLLSQTRIRRLTGLWFKTQLLTVHQLYKSYIKVFPTYWRKDFQRRFWKKNKIFLACTYLKKNRLLRYWKRHNQKRYRWKKNKYKNKKNINLKKHLRF